MTQPRTTLGSCIAFVTIATIQGYSWNRQSASMEKMPLGSNLPKGVNNEMIKKEKNSNSLVNPVSATNTNPHTRPFVRSSSAVKNAINTGSLRQMIKKSRLFEKIQVESLNSTLPWPIDRPKYMKKVPLQPATLAAAHYRRRNSFNGTFKFKRQTDEDQIEMVPCAINPRWNCPKGNTCCSKFSDGVGQMKCCLVSNAECCAADSSCCPYGYRCALGSSQCEDDTDIPKS